MRCPSTRFTPLSSQRHSLFAPSARNVRLFGTGVRLLANPLGLSLEFLHTFFSGQMILKFILAFHSFLHFFACQSLVLGEQKIERVEKFSQQTSC
jgi:hypothetical protein